MSDTTKPDPKAAARAKRPPRTVEQQLADLQAKVARKNAHDAARGSVHAAKSFIATRDYSAALSCVELAADELRKLTGEDAEPATLEQKP